MTWSLWFQLLTLIIVAGFMLAFVISVWRKPKQESALPAIQHRASCHGPAGELQCNGDCQ